MSSIIMVSPEVASVGESFQTSAATVLTDGGHRETALTHGTGDVRPTPPLRLEAGIARHSPVVIVLVHQNSSLNDSVDNFIGRKFAAAQSVLAIYRERIDETFKFYIVTTDETEEELNQLVGIEKDLYVVFPEDELDFEILLGQELACAVPSEATRIWQRT